jgi:hypothetical protein
MKRINSSSETEEVPSFDEARQTSKTPAFL